MFKNVKIFVWKFFWKIFEEFFIHIPKNKTPVFLLVQSKKYIVHITNCDFRAHHRAMVAKIKIYLRQVGLRAGVLFERIEIFLSGVFVVFCRKGLPNFSRFLGFSNFWNLGVVNGFGLYCVGGLGALFSVWEMSNRQVSMKSSEKRDSSLGFSFSRCPSFFSFLIELKIWLISDHLPSAYAKMCLFA